ncbi:hypothetical protein BC628DRAFT_643156 [Trametes gibbosa]|nr:hypothetical protein BC628DRAFT_643156 [Trametes gibbosa]
MARHFHRKPTNTPASSPEARTQPSTLPRRTGKATPQGRPTRSHVPLLPQSAAPSRSPGHPEPIPCPNEVSWTRTAHVSARCAPHTRPSLFPNLEELLCPILPVLGTRAASCAPGSQEPAVLGTKWSRRAEWQRAGVPTLPLPLPVRMPSPDGRTKSASAPPLLFSGRARSSALGPSPAPLAERLTATPCLTVARSVLESLLHLARLPGFRAQLHPERCDRAVAFFLVHFFGLMAPPPPRLFACFHSSLLLRACLTEIHRLHDCAHSIFRCRKHTQ